MAMQSPELVQYAPQPQAALDRVGLARPFEGGAQVGMLLRETCEPLALIGPTHLPRRRLCKSEIIVSVARSQQRRFAICGQSLPSIFAHELKQAKARLPIAILHLKNQTTADE